MKTTPIPSALYCALCALVLITACGEDAYHEAVNELYFEAVAALEEGDLETVEGVAAEFTADYPAEPAGIFLQGVLIYQREGLEAALPLFDTFDTLAYDRFVRNYQELESEERLTALITKDAAVRLANLCVEEGQMSVYQRFSILAHDIEATRTRRER
ncbi:MAG: hypothetical protein GF399_06140 [Candidatus Coatesbacteria bacterium]|nr:hypothetical protein [Candidatus Coatesbacteria bacterium]